MPIIIRLLVIAVIFHINLNLTSQTWERFFGSPYSKETGQDAIECYDKGYLIGTGINEANYSWIIKTDINGELLWDKKFTWTNKSVGLGRVDQNSQGEMVLCGYIYPGGVVQWPLVMKLDQCGNNLWCRTFINEDYLLGSFLDVKLLANGDVIALANLESNEEVDKIFLYYIDGNGNLLWVKSYASKNDHPFVMERLGDRLYNYNNEYQISGWCYYPHPSNPGTGYLRPFFIGIDSLFEEKWILPFGIDEWILGKSYSMGTLNDSTYIGVGFMYADGGPNSIYMFISDEGEELGYLQIENEQIGPDITSNQAVDINRINDSLLISSNLFISEFLDDPFGEIVFDATGNIYNLEYRPGTWGSTQMLKTFNNKYIITCGYEYPNSDKDIYLYKINDSLQWDSVYTGDYTYDSLCPLTIQSDTIDLTNCLVFTDVAEIPTAEEFHTSLNSILINVYPNPSNEGVIHLTYQNTDQHDNLELRCYNLFGQEVYWERLYQQQRESIINEADWGKGMYLAVVYKNGTPVGRVKFVLR